MERSSPATRRRPLRSSRPRISPTRPRSTASGLQMTRVRFMAGSEASRGGALREQRPRCADEVERTGDQHEVVTAGKRRGRVRARLRRSRQRSPRRRARCAAAATSSAGSARGDGGAQATTCAIRSRPSAPSSSAGSRPRRQPSTATTRVARRSPPRAPHRAPARPAALWAPSSTTSGWRPTTSSRPGTRGSGERLGDDVLVERRPEERLRGGERRGGVVALVGAVERHEDVVVGAAGRPQVEQPAAVRQPVGDAVELDAAPPDAPRRPTRSGLLGEDPGDDSGPSSPRTTIAPGFTIPAFSRAIACTGGPRIST